MSYSLKWSVAAPGQLRETYPRVRNVVLAQVTRNVDGYDNPRARGKALVGNLSDRWRYRIGDSRVISGISNLRLVVVGP